MEKKIRSLIKPKRSAWQTFVKRSCNDHKQKKVTIQPAEWTKTYYKAYARMQSIALPASDRLEKKLLKNALIERQSQRNFKQKSRLEMTNISTILQYSIGLNRTYLNKETDDYSRFYPSAGGRYPIEAYIFMQNDAIIDSSIYHYYVRENVLEKLFPIQKDEIKEAFLDDGITQYPCLLVLTGFMPRTTMKYKNRGFHYALIEAGHIGQNVYLISAALGVQCCAIGGFIENEICRLLDINPEEEYPLYVLGLR